MDSNATPAAAVDDESSSSGKWKLISGVCNDMEAKVNDSKKFTNRSKTEEVEAFLSAWSLPLSLPRNLLATKSKSET